ncbi:MAG: inositol monophosphatase family protein [Bacillota bacterium]
MQDIDRTIEKVSNIVVSAGKVIKNRLGSDFTTSCKSCAADLVTEVDRHSQSIILEGLGGAFPGHRLVAEEDFSEEELVLDDRPVWFIDPLDGTTNFVFGIPLCTVSVALTVNGDPVLGVIYDPFREELFTAARGEGAYLNKKRIRVDQARRNVSESLLVTGFPTADQFKDEMLKADYAKLFCKAVDVRALGSAALELAYTACGRITGYWEVTLRPWDVAAGVLLVEEAGGRVSDLYGNGLALGNYVSIIASNGHIHEEFIRDLGFARK